MKESTMITISLRGLPIGWSCPVRQYRSTSKGAGWNVSGQLRGAGVAFPLMNPDDWPNILEHFGFSKLRLSDVLFFFLVIFQRVTSEFSWEWNDLNAGTWARHVFKSTRWLDRYHHQSGPFGWQRQSRSVRISTAFLHLDSAEKLEAGGFHQGS